MPEEVTIREDLKVIQVTSHGVVTEEDFKATLDAILRIREEQGLTKVFVDATKVTSYPSTISIYEFGSKAAAILKGIQVDIAVPPGIRETPVFFENVTRNRGAYISTFDSPEVALARLTQDAEQSHSGDA